MKEAVAAGAQLVVFPEDNNLQLLGMLPGIEELGTAALSENGAEPPPEPAGPPITVADVIHYISPVMAPLIHAVFSRLAGAHGIYLMAGSFLLSDRGRVVNRAFLYGPGGELIGRQDKIHLMPIESEWGIARGQSFSVFDTAIGRLAMPICMDATYYETFRILERLGVEIAMLPIANPEAYNYWLRRCAASGRRCRKAPLRRQERHGRATARLHLTGRAGIFAPLELTPNKDGVLAEVESPHRKGLAVATLDLEALRELRAAHPWRDSNETLYERYFPAVYQNLPQ